MAQASRDIVRRLKSVKNIKKITRAMELVAASKMRKSVARVLASRPYADAAWKLVMDLMPKAEPEAHQLLQEREVKRAAVIVISSNRGLCGSFNQQSAGQALAVARKEKWGSDVAVDYITFGKKAAQILAAESRSIAADYSKDDITDSVDDILPVAKEVISGFVSHKYDEVDVIYTHFVSSLKQQTRVRYLLPLVKPSRFLGHIASEKAENSSQLNFSDFYFEPSRDSVLEVLLPRLIELQIYQAVLESEASEHSARMLAMRNASDSATDMIDTLTLAYNQARQASITAELAEISSAATAIL